MVYMTEMTLNKTENIYSKGRVKLTKNSKGHTWEIVIVAESEKPTKEDLDILGELNKVCEEKWGSGDI